MSSFVFQQGIEVTVAEAITGWEIMLHARQEVAKTEGLELGAVKLPKGMSMTLGAYLMSGIMADPTDADKIMANPIMFWDFTMRAIAACDVPLTFDGNDLRASYLATFSGHKYPDKKTVERHVAKDSSKDDYV